MPKADRMRRGAVNRQQDVAKQLINAPRQGKYHLRQADYRPVMQYARLVAENTGPVLIIMRDGKLVVNP